MRSLGGPWWTLVDTISGPVLFSDSGVTAQLFTSVGVLIRTGQKPSNLSTHTPGGRSITRFAAYPEVSK